MVKIFDDIARFGDEGAGYTEPHFPYLNRTGRVDLARVRALIEDWFGRYPRAHQAELRARLRSSNNETFDGAFFELYLHELLRRLSYELDVHPALGPDGRARPDFLARRGGEDRFYLEGRVARDESASKTAAQARVNEAYEALNRIESPDFFLSLEDHGSPATPVPKRFRVEVERFLRAQDYSRCVQLFRDGGFGALPVGRFEHHGWKVTYSPIPRKESARGEPGLRPIAVTGPAEVSRLDNVTALRTAVQRKAGKYGRLDLPLVVAVNVLGKRLSHYWIVEALLGSEYGTVRDGVATTARLPDGVWVGKGGPQHQRVSAVLVASSLGPWSVAQQAVSVYHNPWAYRPCVDDLTQLTHSVPSTDVTRVECQDGIAPHAIFSLPADWPGD